MSGDEPLGDGHTHWHSPEECMTVEGKQLKDITRCYLGSDHLKKYNSENS